MGFDQRVGGVEICFDVRADGTESVETFAARELHIALLDVASSDVVEAGVAKHKGKWVVGIPEMRAAAADDNGELAFVFHALGVRRKDDRIGGADDGRWRLEEHQRLFGNFIAELCGMCSVVASNADDFAGLYRSD